CRIMKKILIIYNQNPYDGTDVTWNGLRLAETLHRNGQSVRIFLMNDAVDMARDECNPPVTYDQDLSAMLKGLIKSGVPVKVCGTCMARCGVYKNRPYFEGAEKSTMQALSEWVIDSDQVLTF
ncbi:MAG: DsrE family protein, partial [Petrimonas sp.]|nr:DsrE family protein [Petrimonas sp.]